MSKDTIGLGPRDETRRGDWACTSSGRMFYPLDPRPDDIGIEDIAAHLSKICRFGGACREFYSVAQHSIMVAWLVASQLKHDLTEDPALDWLPLPREVMLAALLHDAAEAYLGDMVRPLKRAPEMRAYCTAEKALQAAVAKHFGFPAVLFDHPMIKRADNLALAAEAYAIMPEPSVLRWNLPEATDEIRKDAQFVLAAMLSPARAEAEFLDYYQRIITMPDELPGTEATPIGVPETGATDAEPETGS